MLVEHNSLNAPSDLPPDILCHRCRGTGLEPSVPPLPERDAAYLVVGLTWAFAGALGTVLLQAIFHLFIWGA